MVSVMDSMGILTVFKFKEWRASEIKNPGPLVSLGLLPVDYPSDLPESGMLSSLENWANS